MKKNKEEEEFVLKIEISETSSDLIMRLETIVKNDITSHKLPKELQNPETTSDEE